MTHSFQVKSIFEWRIKCVFFMKARKLDQVFKLHKRIEMCENNMTLTYLETRIAKHFCHKKYEFYAKNHYYSIVIFLVSW
jgi:hypothetical protein